MALYPDVKAIALYPNESFENNFGKNCLITGKVEFTKGPVIFNAGYRGGVKQGGVPKYFATFSWGMKTFCHVLMGYENIFE